MHNKEEEWNIIKKHKNKKPGKNYLDQDGPGRGKEQPQLTLIILKAVNGLPMMPYEILNNKI